MFPLGTIHPLDGDGVSFFLYYSLSKENKQLESSLVNIPSTILFEQGFAKAWFFTEKTGVKKRIGKEVSLKRIYHHFVKGCKEGDIVAVFMSYGTGGVDSQREMCAFQYFDKEGLRAFLFSTAQKPKGILQKFVPPKGDSNLCIQAVWSPQILLTDCRRNIHNLYDRHYPPFDRAATFEGGDHMTQPVVLAPQVIEQVKDLCKEITTKFAQVEHMNIVRMVLYFKVDKKNCLRLLFSSSMRICDKGQIGQFPVNLTVKLLSLKKQLNIPSNLLVYRLNLLLDKADDCLEFLLSLENGGGLVFKFCSAAERARACHQIMGYLPTDKSEYLEINGKELRDVLQAIDSDKVDDIWVSAPKEHPDAIVTSAMWQQIFQYGGKSKPASPRSIVSYSSTSKPDHPSDHHIRNPTNYFRDMQSDAILHSRSRPSTRGGDESSRGSYRGTDFSGTSLNSRPSTVGSRVSRPATMESLFSRPSTVQSDRTSATKQRIMDKRQQQAERRRGFEDSLKGKRTGSPDSDGSFPKKSGSEFSPPSGNTTTDDEDSQTDSSAPERAMWRRRRKRKQGDSGKEDKPERKSKIQLLHEKKLRRLARNQASDESGKDDDTAGESSGNNNTTDSEKRPGTEKTNPRVALSDAPMTSLSNGSTKAPVSSLSQAAANNGQGVQGAPPSFGNGKSNWQSAGGTGQSTAQDGQSTSHTVGPGSKYTDQVQRRVTGGNRPDTAPIPGQRDKSPTPARQQNAAPMHIRVMERRSTRGKSNTNDQSRPSTSLPKGMTLMSTAGASDAKQVPKNEFSTRLREMKMGMRNTLTADLEREAGNQPLQPAIPPSELLQMAEKRKEETNKVQARINELRNTSKIIESNSESPKQNAKQDSTEPALGQIVKKAPAAKRPPTVLPTGTFKSTSTRQDPPKEALEFNNVDKGKLVGSSITLEQLLKTYKHMLPSNFMESCKQLRADQLKYATEEKSFANFQMNELSRLNIKGPPRGLPLVKPLVLKKGDIELDPPNERRPDSPSNIYNGGLSPHPPFTQPPPSGFGHLFVVNQQPFSLADHHEPAFSPSHYLSQSAASRPSTPLDTLPPHPLYEANKLPLFSKIDYSAVVNRTV